MSGIRLPNSLGIVYRNWDGSPLPVPPLHEATHGQGNHLSVAEAIRWHMVQVGRLAKKLKDTPDVTGSLLDHTAIVFLNTGCEYNVGPHRLYVPLARHYALRGYLALRFDLGGIGDSQPPPGRDENLPYPDHALDDVRAAVALVRGRPGIRRVILAGLCSGAWHAFRAAVEGIPVEFIFLVNAPLFLRDGASSSRLLSEVYELQRYGRSFRDPAKWAKALRGRAGYWTFTRLAVASLYRKSGASIRSIRTALGADEPAGLGADLQRIAAQGIQGLFVFDTGEEGLEYLRLCADPARLKRLTRGRFRQVEVAGAGHTFRPLEAQRVLRRLLLDFVEGRHANDGRGALHEVARAGQLEGGNRRRPLPTVRVFGAP